MPWTFLAEPHLLENSYCDSLKLITIPFPQFSLNCCCLIICIDQNPLMSAIRHFISNTNQYILSYFILFLKSLLVFSANYPFEFLVCYLLSQKFPLNIFGCYSFSRKFPLSILGCYSFSRYSVTRFSNTHV